MTHPQIMALARVLELLAEYIQANPDAETVSDAHMILSELLDPILSK